MTARPPNTAPARADGYPDAERPAYRLFPVEVARTRQLSPSFVRITLRGTSLRRFGWAGADQRVKIVLPRPGQTVHELPDGPDWYTAWLAMPEHTRPILRTYTVRAFRAEATEHELDIDFVLHSAADGDTAHENGPAAAWAARARPGDRIQLVGPDRPGSGQAWGRTWVPSTPTGPLLLAGDETAVPAVAAILESLPAEAHGIACLEVPQRADRQQWRIPANMRVRWFSREDDPREHGALLERGIASALTELRPGTWRVNAEPNDVDVDSALLWEAPESTEEGFYGWLAGEAAVIKRVRRLLVRDFGLPRSAVAFMGYWRLGSCW